MRRHRRVPAWTWPTGSSIFIEVNPRIQVEHTVTEEVTGIDIVKAQIRVAEGETLSRGDRGAEPGRRAAERPRHPVPDHHRGPAEQLHPGLWPDHRLSRRDGVRHPARRRHGLFSGAVITRHYDSLLEKVTAWAPTPEEAVARMDRALREFRIRGVATNIAFVENLLKHPDFVENRYHTRFIDETPELFDFKRRRDRATKLLTFIGDITVNGNPEVAGRVRPPADAYPPRAPEVPTVPPPAGLKQMLDAEGPKARGRLDAGAEKAADDRHDDARRAPVAAGDADALDRHGAGGARLCARDAGALQHGVLGRRHLRRRLSVSAGVPLAAAAQPARGDAEPADADAGALVERGRLLEPAGQCRARRSSPARPRRAWTSSASSTR